MQGASASPLGSVPVTALRQVGQERAALLERLGVRTVHDLLCLRPRRHEDRRTVVEIGQLELRKTSLARGEIVDLGIKRYSHGRRSIFEFVLDDGSGRLHCRWWNLPYMQNYFDRGECVLVCGKVMSVRPRRMDHPETEVIDGGAEASIHLSRIVPVYPLTEGLSQRWLRALIWRVLDEFKEEIERHYAGPSFEGMLDRAPAIRRLHFPEELDEPELARRRLALDELLELQTAMRVRRERLLTKAPQRPAAGDNSLIRPFLLGLPFSLTRGQTEVLREIRDDLATGRPMRRLLQGEVGSGKTVVAACAALMVIESGYSVALMAPTEILAEQHLKSFEQWFDRLGVPVWAYTAKRKTAETNDDALPQPGKNARTATALVVGTHALIETSFSMADLGLVIIDEQHKFGVQQREQLLRKGRYPHLLVMTATPIPRTLGLTLYGDLDLSTIQESPAGRKNVRTYIRSPDRLPKVHEFIRQKLGEGRQAFVVYPRIEESDAADLKAVTREIDRLRAALAPFQVARLHGRLGTDEKEETMRAFRENRIHVLVATQVIEVGVDVPNATVMLIENADHFGLAQLHQLRGRIGRGSHESHCILVASAKSDEAKRRLEVLAETDDGFRIAEEDLRQRGPGDFLGCQQSGMPPLIFADLIGDRELVEEARRLARLDVHQ